MITDQLHVIPCFTVTRLLQRICLHVLSDFLSLTWFLPVTSVHENKVRDEKDSKWNLKTEENIKAFKQDL